MLETLLRTKLLIPPPRPNLVPRPQLIERLNQGIAPGRRLTLVSAPAGFGKTTLVSAWARQMERPIAWLSLDQSDNDLIRFFTYFVAALQTVKSALGEPALAALRSSAEITIETVITILLNETSELPDDVVLIMDDYHLIESRPIVDALSYLLDGLSPNMHIVILTRADPALPLARMRARGELAEIRERDLRFSLDESSDFLESMLGSTPSGENLQILQSRTEGWVAGLQLAALAIQGHEDPSTVITSFGGGHDYIVAYLIEEVLNRQPESTQMFLMQTSILSKMNGSLCDALTRRSDGADMLAWCEKANLFVSRIGNDYGWYRYHSLFADVLASRLGRFHPDQIRGLHLRAAEWFSHHDLVDDAFEHALAAGNYAFAADIVENQAQDLLHLGNLSTLRSWLDKLPAEIVDRRPRLCVDRAWVDLLTGQLDSIEEFLVRAERNLNYLDQPDDLRGQIAAIRAYSAGRLGKFDLAISQAHAALDLLPKDNASVRSVVAFVLGGIYQLQGDLERALTYLEEASRLGDQAGNIHLAVGGLNLIGEILKSQGKLAEAEQVYARALRLGSDPDGNPLPFTAGVHAFLAELRLIQRDLAGSRELALTGLELGKKWANTESLIFCHLALAQIHHLEGDPGQARQSLQEAWRLAATYQAPADVEQRIKACEEALGTDSPQMTGQGLLDPLSHRELEVLGLLAAGLTNQEIADRLIISLGTVKAHSSNIYRKLEVRNRAQAVVRAGELKLL